MVSGKIALQRPGPAAHPDLRLRQAKQNGAPPDALWQQCEVGKKHAPDEDHEISEVRKNGGARDYCIDGCSVPPSGVAVASDAGIFLALSRNNPAGHPASSFYQACANHDVCYQSCDKEQKYCDYKLEEDAKAACEQIPADHTIKVAGRYPDGTPYVFKVNTRKKCRDIAEYYRMALRAFGEFAFNKRRQQYCQCC